MSGGFFFFCFFFLNLRLANFLLLFNVKRCSVIISTVMLPHIRGGGHIVFGGGPIGVGFGGTLPCLYSTLSTSGWILSKVS